jgi:predicted negative regulator of RcsB-dependent stress response
MYAEAVYWDLTARPDERLAALERFVSRAAQRLDPEAPQHLLERGRYELGVLLAANGRLDEALATWGAIVDHHADGRYAAAALQRSGEALLAAGRADAARRAWERLLAQYPGYLFIDDVRDGLRGLPN